MALFIRKQSNEDQLFKITKNIPGQSEGPAEDSGFIKLLVGLGNIGAEYDDTRHNIGFKAIEKYARINKFPRWQEKTKFKAYITEDFIAGQKIILAKPTTYMNLSGETIRSLKDFYKLQNNDIIVLHDELDLPFGEVRKKQGGGSAGNNGIKSIISHIGEDFNRIRIGIKNDLLEKIDPTDFVLAKFSKVENTQIDKIIEESISYL
jgi:PTH1 family peptidyl-tRNA hydrolase